MFITDMDYTLLNHNKEVSERNKVAIKGAMEKGIMVVVATGRVFTSARMYTRLLGIDTPIIASNGAIIREDHTNRTIYQSLLPDEAAMKMIRLCKEYGLYCHVYTKDKIYTERIVNISKTYSEWNKRYEDENRIDIHLIPKIEDVIELEKGNILKAVVVDDDSEKLRSIREQILETGLVSVSQSLSDNIEVMNSEVSKGNAAKILAEMYGIDREEVIAIGDNENDISMIEYAGLGIAVGNADDFVKNAADFVTGSYDRDGVAEAIERFILN